MSSCPLLVLDWNQTRLQILKIFSIFWNHWPASIPWLCFIVIIYILIFLSQLEHRKCPFLSVFQPCVAFKNYYLKNPSSDRFQILTRYTLECCLTALLISKFCVSKKQSCHYFCKVTFSRLGVIGKCSSWLRCNPYPSKRYAV